MNYQWMLLDNSSRLRNHDYGNSLSSDSVENKLAKQFISSGGHTIIGRKGTKDFIPFKCQCIDPLKCCIVSIMVLHIRCLPASNLKVKFETTFIYFGLCIKVIWDKPGVLALLFSAEFLFLLQTFKV